MVQVSAQIRPVREHELKPLLALYQHLHPDGHEAAPAEQLQAAWRRMVASEMVHCLVAEAHGQLVGTCTLTVVPNVTRGARPYGLIENVVTHAEHRRRGIGRAVLERALRIAWERGCYKVMLLTSRSSPGVHRFYRRCGFRSGRTGYVATPPDESP
jgi:GNAT superfamily N-acetyltransferase